MLSKANANVKGIAPASEPAWKRRRDQSPPKQSGFYTPASSRSSQESKIQNDKIQDLANPKRTNLFQADWKSNDIAKAQGEAKRKDMEVLMNRFKTVSQTETEQNRGGAGQNSSPNRQNPKSPVRKSPMPRPRSRSPVRKSPAKPVHFKFYIFLTPLRI